LTHFTSATSGWCMRKLRRLAQDLTLERYDEAEKQSQAEKNVDTL